MSVFCKVCEKVFSKQANLNKHIRTVHKGVVSPVSYHQSMWNYKCLHLDCNSSFKQNSGLLEHLEKVHNLHFEIEKLEFSALSDFQAWKIAIEEKTTSNYVVASKFKSAKGHCTYYNCNRTGKIKKDLHKIPKRLTKSQGSCKLDRACTSQIKVLERDAKFIVTFIKTHYGHSAQLQHVRISKIQRCSIASKLINGAPPVKVLDIYREQIGGDIKRIDLLARKDVINIKKAFNINISDGIRHDDDATSIDLWIKECESNSSRGEENPVLVYKKQGLVDTGFGFSQSDFCLVIMNKFQKSILEQFGNNIIAVDGTHGLNNYNFELTSVLVVDEFGEGLPIAFMFSNRKDTYTYEIFFSSIKSRLGGVISATTFISDIAPAFYNAWKLVMGPVRYQIYCSWHIDRAWQSNLMKIVDKEKRTNVYKTLKVLQQSTAEFEFESSLQNFVHQLFIDNDTKNFGEYFHDNYSKNASQWAYCYRTKCGINTNMRLESFHKVIKYFYCDGKKVKRLDKALHLILKYVRDKNVERVIKLTKGKYTSHTKDIIKRHNSCLECNFILTSIDQNVHKWEVSNQDTESEVYVVEQVSDKKCCDLICFKCKICIHMYTCTCIDFLMRSIICKHIHFVIMNTCTTSNTNAMEKKIADTIDNDNLNVEVIQGKKYNVDDKLMFKISETFLNLQKTDLQSLDPEVASQICSHLHIIDNLLSISRDNKKFAEDPNGCHEPANKNIEKQVSFYRTQKQRKYSRPVEKPTKTETMTLSNMLKGNTNQVYISESSSCDHNYISHL